GRVEDVRPVGCGDQNNSLSCVKPVHFDEELVQRLLTLVMTAAKPCSTQPAHCVDFVGEDDARRMLLALLEEISHARGSDADEHFDEVRPADAEERDPCF